RRGFTGGLLNPTAIPGPGRTPCRGPRRRRPPGCWWPRLRSSRPRPWCGCGRTTLPPAAAPPTSPATSWIADYAWRPTDAPSSHARQRFRCLPDGDRRRMEPIVTELPRETRVLDAVVSLVDSLLDDFDVVDLLTELTEQCAQLLDVAAAGLLLATPRRQLQLMAATSEKIHDLELFQLQADQGPCLDCYATGQPISVADIQTEAARWPRFAAAATEAGFASVHAVPMRAASTVLGALGLFGTGVGELNDADRLVAQTLAHIACVAILQDHPATPATVLRHLQPALTSRIVVDQAKGFLSQRLEVSVDDAFTLLRRYARTHGDHLTELSRRLITEPEARQTILAAMTQMMG